MHFPPRNNVRLDLAGSSAGGAARAGRGDGSDVSGQASDEGCTGQSEV